MFNILYDTPEGTKVYCLCDISLGEAKKQLRKFRERYMERQPDGSWKGKAYPNGRGFYQIFNVRIAHASVLS